MAAQPPKPKPPALSPPAASNLSASVSVPYWAMWNEVLAAAQSKSGKLCEVIQDMIQQQMGMKEATKPPPFPLPAGFAWRTIKITIEEVSVPIPEGSS